MRKMGFCAVLFWVLCIISVTFVFSPIGEGADQMAFPEKDIKMIIPWSAGGGTDIIGRQIASQMEKIFDVNIIVENVTGGGGAVGFKCCADSAPDGYTLTMGTPSMLLQKYANSTYVDYKLLDHNFLAQVFSASSSKRKLKG
ncbi:MAG: hypothetical protein LBS53_03030 [Synergistaceae bacterium]|jgi:tripartite-type tricarboxylate transporter receptor subunit TctC|nr:hypothetical protein [Synergistaceae bacterium]